MGNCGDNEGKPIVLVFDCISYGKHEINCMDGLTLKKVLGELSRRIRLPQSKIVDVQYRYESLNKAKKIRELNLPNWAVLLVKLSD